MHCYLTHLEDKAQDSQPCVFLTYAEDDLVQYIIKNTDHSIQIMNDNANRRIIISLIHVYAYSHTTIYYTHNCTVKRSGRVALTNSWQGYLYRNAQLIILLMWVTPTRLCWCQCERCLQKRTKWGAYCTQMSRKTLGYGHRTRLRLRKRAKGWANRDRSALLRIYGIKWPATDNKLVATPQRPL